MWLARDKQREEPGSLGQRVTGKYRIFPLEPIPYSDGSWGVPMHLSEVAGAEISASDSPELLAPGGGPVEVKLVLASKL